MRRPLFESPFNFLHFHVYGSVAGLPGLHGRGVATNYEEVNYPFLATFYVDLSERLILELNYHPAELGAEEVERPAGLLPRRPGADGPEPEARHETAELLSAAEREQVLHGLERGGRLLPHRAHPPPVRAAGGRARPRPWPSSAAAGA